MNPLSATLELQLVALARRAKVRAIPRPAGAAPSTFDHLADAAFRRNGMLFVPVWNGASDDTIWSGPRVNFLFRAWHDSHHLETGAGFDTVGESHLAEHGARMIDGARDRAILRAETIGQVLYLDAWGTFPMRQREFVAACVATSINETVARGGY